MTDRRPRIRPMDSTTSTGTTSRLGCFLQILLVVVIAVVLMLLVLWATG